MNTILFDSDPQELDQVFGYRIREVEEILHARALALEPQGTHATWGKKLHQGNQTWVGLDPQSIHTPYSELKKICELLNPFPGTHVVDLGAGVGRLGLVLHHLYPQVRFTGLEYVPERVVEGQRIMQKFNCKNASLVVEDLAREDFSLPLADYYFIYDYGTIPHIRRTLNQLSELADKKNFKVIARGKGCRSLIDLDFPWLSQVFTPHREENFTIYSMSF